MRLTRYFMPTLKQNPSESVIASHRYMLRAGMIRQASAGIYSWLPLGLKVLDKISAVVREEQARIESQQILMPTIQTADLWKKSGRYDGYGPEMLRFKDRHNRELLYGPTNEEQITEIIANSIKSLKIQGSKKTNIDITFYLKDKSFVLDLWDEDVVDIFNKE